jgi:hypothetical protein
VKSPTGDDDPLKVSFDDFYAAPAVAAPPPTVQTLPPRVTRARRRSRWPVAAAIAVALVAAVVGLAVVLWPHSSGPGKPDPGMARLFGQQTRVQLPQPVETEDCTAAVKAFPAIAADATARAAFVAGCLHG